MLSAINIKHELKIPNHVGPVEHLPQDGMEVANILDKAIRFHEGLEMLSPAQFNDPIIAGQIQTKMNELSGLLNLPSTNMGLTESTENLKVISQEGVGSFFKSIGEAILRWISSVVKWIKETLLQSKLMDTHMARAAAHNKAVIEEIFEKKAETVDVNEVHTVTWPGSTIIVFHTPKHLPRPGYRYNYGNLQTSAQNISKYYDTLVDAFMDEIKAVTGVIDTVTTYMQKNQPVPTFELNKMNQRRKLFGLAHNNFSMIGFDIAARPSNNENAIRKEKIVVENLGKELGWNNSVNFTFEYTLAQMRQFGEENISRIDGVSAKLGKLHDKSTFRDMERRLSVLEVFIKNTLKDSDLDPAHQTVALRRLQSVQDIVSQLQTNARSVDLFSRNYQRILIAISNGFIRDLTKETNTGKK